MAKKKFNDIGDVLYKMEDLLEDTTVALQDVYGECRDKKQKKLLEKAIDNVEEVVELLQ